MRGNVTYKHLATEGYVDQKVATDSATFQGTYNLVTDLSLSVSSTRAEIAAMLATVITGADNNDFSYVEIPVSDNIPARIQRTDRYKYNGTSWAYEFCLSDTDPAPYRQFRDTWVTDSTLQEFCEDVAEDPTVMVGDLYLGSLTCSGLPEGMMIGEVSVQVINGHAGLKLLLLTLTSTNLSPYHWELSYFNGTLYGWRSWIIPQEVADVEALSNAQCQLLKPGHVVIKVTGNERHTYVVSYKDEVKGEMSLTYTDHQNTEEVYYEVRNNVWTFVQKDIFNFNTAIDAVIDTMNMSEENGDITIQYDNGQ